MRKAFENYLVKCGYRQVTGSGNPSTVYDYCHRVDRVARKENLTWEEMAEKMGEILSLYEKGGIKQEQGRTSHGAVINALKRFSEFVKSAEQCPSR